MVLGKFQGFLCEGAKENPESTVGKSQSYPGKYLHQGPGEKKKKKDPKMGKYGVVDRF